ncbi:MAG: TetR/AcrR family transcriptional regulator [Rhodoplanes sp.]|uniref:TetR/AcrR family transcriptional regulator n=1 Tax=Rhodoplanes sp. TaxID=1968906 RepID=UPI0017F7A406|nr:TetR/AcrR family transcriptional regulator [Rhodoplanes sp.]NVO13552.1 TetR/AcrR family transcriptional regulator [Rhodoplanes sp.]
MARKYELKRRAVRQDATRQKIVSAAVELHCTVGPMRTSILAIAERAGVERPTVYRHFPTLESLYEACAHRFWTENPLPDPTRWCEIADPEARLRRGLSELYAFFEKQSPALWNIMRDIEDEPDLRTFCGSHADEWTRMRSVLAEAFEADAARRQRLDAALLHALDFFSWRASRGHGIPNDVIIDLMIGMIRAL